MPKTLPRRLLRIGRSRTGLGVYATTPIRKRSFITQYWGPLLTTAQADKRGDNRYLFEVNARWTIDGSTRRNLARYINHSCRPNADPEIIKHKIFIRAIRNIAPGDEITYDYGKDHFNAYIKPHGCKCVKCRERKRGGARKTRRKAASRRKTSKARKRKAR